MAAIWTFKYTLLNKSLHFDLNFTEVCSEDSINNDSSLVQEIAWCRTGNIPLLKPIMTLSTDILPF